MKTTENTNRPAADMIAAVRAMQARSAAARAARNVPILNGKHVQATVTACPSCVAEGNLTTGRMTPTLSVIDGETAAFCHHHGYTDSPFVIA